MKAWLQKLVILTSLFGICASTVSAETLRAGTLKIAALTNAWVALNEGIFKKNGLDVSFVEMQGGTDMIGALQAGSVDIVQVIPGGALIAVERGFDLALVFQNEIAKATPPDSGSVQVRVDSDIKTLRDLEGKKVAILQFRNQATLDAQAVMQKAGVDLSKVQFVELPFVAHVDALRTKQVDAVVTVDPFTTVLTARGIGRVISWNYVESIPQQPLGSWWVKRSFLEKNGDAVAKFGKSLKEADEFLNADPERAHEKVVAFTGLDAGLVKMMPLIGWDYRVRPDRWQELIELLRSSGELKKSHQAAEYFSKEITPYVVGKGER